MRKKITNHQQVIRLIEILAGEDIARYELERKTGSTVPGTLQNI